MSSFGCRLVEFERSGGRPVEPAEPWLELSRESEKERGRDYRRGWRIRHPAWHSGAAVWIGPVPGVDAPVIDRVLAAWRQAPTWAAVTAYNDGNGHPFVFSADAYPTLRALHGDKAVWKIVEREPPGRVARMSVDLPLPVDVDTWDDYLAACQTFGFRAQPRKDKQVPPV